MNNNKEKKVNSIETLIEVEEKCISSEYDKEWYKHTRLVPHCH